MIDESELKPCPFCGEEATIRESSCGINEYCICCDECACFTPFCEEDDEAAAELWNTRDDSASLNEYTGLLSCPLCGGRASIETSAKTFYVTCDECKFTMRHTGKRAEAVKAWNKRATL